MILDAQIASLGEGVLDAELAVLFTCRTGASVYVTCITLISEDTSNRTCNVYVRRSSGTLVRICPKDLTLRPGYEVQLNAGYSLQAGDTVEAEASVAEKINWTANGFERAT